MTASAWNPEQYERFKDERTAPFFDLLALVRPVSGGRVVDLGCGTGELTRQLHSHTQARSTVGLDNSETMLAGSAQHAGKGLTFRLGTIARFAPGRPFDLVFSNAALQWLPDHGRLLERLSAGIAPGGQIAIQVPANGDHPTHRTAFALASEEPWNTELGGYRRSWPVLAPDQYAEELDRVGFQEQHVRLQVYAHRLSTREDTVEWVKGTLLTPYQERMSPEAYRRFLAAYRERLLPQLRDDRPYFYAFKRILFWGRKSPISP